MEAIGVIGVPSSAGAYAPGQELAPLHLREAGLLAELRERGVAVHDRGDLSVRRWSPDRASPRAQNVEGVLATIREVTSAVANCRADGDRALVLGGDCTVGLGAIAALDGPGVAYLDLHADMNVPASVRDGALDWMGLGHALALEGCVPELAGVCSLAADQVVLLGFDPGQATTWEREQIAAQNVRVVEVGDLADDPIAAARRVLSTLGDERAEVAVHFDVDVIDFVDAPLSENTGRNVGVELDAAFEALCQLLADQRVATLTVAELNPLHGEADGSTLARFVRALGRACEIWSEGAAKGAAGAA